MTPRPPGPGAPAAPAAEASATATEGVGAHDGLVRCGVVADVKDAPRAAAADGPAVATPPVGGDNIEDDTSSTTTLDINPGGSIEASLEHAGDHDYIGVTMVGGEVYEFTVDADDTGASGPDLMLYVYDENGEFVTVVDSNGGGESETFDFLVEQTGQYFIDVAGYNDAAIGGYTLFGAVDTTDPDPNAGSPLAALDWGTRVDTDGKTNADGDEIIQVYFAKAGEVVEHPITPINVAAGWSEWERDYAFTSFEQYEHIINVDFREVELPGQGRLRLHHLGQRPGAAGRHVAAGRGSRGRRLVQQRRRGLGRNGEGGLEQGGYGFITFIHELGHGMGMAHPHDNGGSSTVMNGVERPSTPRPLRPEPGRLHHHVLQRRLARRPDGLVRSATTTAGRAR